MDMLLIDNNIEKCIQELVKKAANEPMVHDMLAEISHVDLNEKYKEYTIEIPGGLNVIFTHEVSGKGITCRRLAVFTADKTGRRPAPDLIQILASEYFGFKKHINDCMVFEDISDVTNPKINIVEPLS